MNIFVLDQSPRLAAEYQCDKHVVKMVLESCQLLCGVHHFYQTGATRAQFLYKFTHKNHPCSIWARTSKANYSWLWIHAKCLAMEYTFRYGKIHKSELLIDYLRQAPEYFGFQGLTPFALAMPEQYRQEDAVQAYRNYYGEKMSFAKWTRREIPPWVQSWYV